MIRIRDKSGKLIPLPDEAATIELCSSDGKLARLFLRAGERILVLSPEDKHFRDFCHQVGVEVADVINVGK